MTSLAPFTGYLRSLCVPSARQPLRNHKAIGNITDLANSLHNEADCKLSSRAELLREAVRNGAEPASDEILTAGFALIFEAARRSLGIAFYDVQIEAGIALARQSISEMATGEGKTFVAAFPAFLHGLTGRGVHVMTVNTYLAERDHAVLAPLFQLLGMTAGLLRSQSSIAEKKAAYQCDITYGPGYEFGFDYLRDQVASLTAPKPKLGESLRSRINDKLGTPTPATVQRGHAFAIVDEADSLMIDEATTPLVLSGSVAAQAQNADAFLKAKLAAEHLLADKDYVADSVTRILRLTDGGAKKLAVPTERIAQLGLDRPWHQYVEQALRARHFLKRNGDYVVQDGRVLLVDEFSGRIFSDRSLRDGLHQAVEAKENLTITAENQPLAHISRQRFFRLYDGLCGMTGTTSGAERELHEVYDLHVVAIPTRIPCQRKSFPTRYFATQDSKWIAIVEELNRLHQTRQPVLVGTRTIESSEILAQRLQAGSISFRLLNGKQDEEEAMIVARAGEAGSITIATNMAGRGTDIKLGPDVSALGGLHVIGTERHETARVDRQLVGRAARQGDPGSCQFFVSADDGLVCHHAPWLGRRMSELGNEQGEIEADLSRQVLSAQKDAERSAYVRRSLIYRHEDWLDKVLSRLAAGK